MNVWDQAIHRSGIGVTAEHYIDMAYGGLPGIIATLKRTGSVDLSGIPGSIQRQVMSRVVRAGYPMCCIRHNALHLCAWSYEHKGVITYKTPYGSRMEIVADGNMTMGRLLKVVNDTDFYILLAALHNNECGYAWSESAIVRDWLAESGYKETGLKNVLRRCAE